MQRRDFIAGIAGSAAAWPLAAGAQQASDPVIGFLDPRTPEAIADRLRGFRQGLREGGFVEGDNVAIVFRFAENQLARLPELVADLIRRNVTVLVTSGAPAALAIKATKTMIPGVFLIGDDPVRLGLVTSIARPEGRLTGINIVIVELATKRIELLHQFVPTATHIAVLVDRADPVTENQLREVQRAAVILGLRVQVLNASTSQEMYAAFEGIGPERPDMLFVTASPFLNGRYAQLAQLATFHRLPAAFPLRQAVEAGGLMSYGGNIVNAFLQAGNYTARILKGAKPSDLPVVQSSVYEFVINARTARMLKLTVPPTLLALADDVIE
jgi:putative tryptophan/tyrosine transport system substrate-binding protein